MNKKTIPLAILGVGLLSATGCDTYGTMGENISNSIGNIRENTDTSVDYNNDLYTDTNKTRYYSNNLKRGTESYNMTDTDNSIFNDNFDFRYDVLDGENDDVFDVGKPDNFDITTKNTIRDGRDITVTPNPAINKKSTTANDPTLNDTITATPLPATNNNAITTPIPTIIPTTTPNTLR